ncbi:MAG: hypothetical protein PHW32_04265 [Bacilli bacterium]|nr:hypothetical protein [Bacilli bacterium]MDD4283054.1 hypothetical protein [Bacilli bacterium]MDD4719134.1 hypothetical protein [Bacilli bacterium]
MHKGFSGLPESELINSYNYKNGVDYYKKRVLNVSYQLNVRMIINNKIRVISKKTIIMV